jgi:hypothetical protein
MERDMLDDAIVMASIDKIPLDMAQELIKVLEPNVLRYERVVLAPSRSIENGEWTSETRRALMLQSKLGILKCRVALANEAAQGSVLDS